MKVIVVPGGTATVEVHEPVAGPSPPVPAWRTIGGQSGWVTPAAVTVTVPPGDGEPLIWGETVTWNVWPTPYLADGVTVTAVVVVACSTLATTEPEAGLDVAVVGL